MKKRIFKKKLKKLSLDQLISVWLSCNSVKNIKIIEKELEIKDFSNIMARGGNVE